MLVLVFVLVLSILVGMDGKSCRVLCDEVYYRGVLGREEEVVYRGV